MRVRLIRPRLDDDPERYELHLEHETDGDRAMLQELVDSGFDCGFHASRSEGVRAQVDRKVL